ncbi:MAG: hypothetical protein JWP94_3213 [Mucilaginibacter sp.]|nr:hypothetical protein [Mucilaginibacter sp.]
MPNLFRHLTWKVSGTQVNDMAIADQANVNVLWGAEINSA